jgi:soluble cytochrome b562
LKKIVYDFLDKYLPNHYEGQIEKAQKAVTGLVDTKNDLKKNIADNKDDIAKMKKEIEELTKKNENMAEKLSETKEEIKDWIDSFYIITIKKKV